jgi:uncharacterized protein
MTKNTKKILGEERRDLLLSWLQEASKPLSGNDLAKRTNVSRQVIVQDISLLKARNEPIMATAQGYIYMREPYAISKHERVIACSHKPENTVEEMTILVDHGVTIKDVKIDHPVYGDLTASIMVSNRTELEHFLKRVNETKATYLSALTSGTHLHTIEADSIKKLDIACKALEEAGFLLHNE